MIFTSLKLLRRTLICGSLHQDSRMPASGRNTGFDSEPAQLVHRMRSRIVRAVLALALLGGTAASVADEVEAGHPAERSGLLNRFIHSPEKPAAQAEPHVRGGEMRGAPIDILQEHGRLLSGLPKERYRFGIKVSIDDGTAIVGAPSQNLSQGYWAPGEAFIYEYEDGRWVHQATLVPSDSASNDFFGVSVAISGNVAAVTAAKLTIGDAGEVPGKVYVFERVEGEWLERQILTSSSSAPSDLFGSALALDGGRLLVGAPAEIIGPNILQGAAYLFQFDGSVWEESARFVRENGAFLELFGGSVAFYDEMVLIASPGEAVAGVPMSGAVHAYEYMDEEWQAVALISEGQPTAGGEFGRAISIGQDGIAIGRAGAAYIYAYDQDEWLLQAELIPDVEQVGGSYGTSIIHIDGGVAIGEEAAEVDDIPHGVVHVFRQEELAWEYDGALLASDTLTNNMRFGSALAYAEGQLLVGAPFSNVHNIQQGAIYAYSQITASQDAVWIEGTIWSEGHCSNDWLPLEAATIEIDAGGEVITLASRYDGFYRAKLPPGSGSASLHVSGAGHVDKLIADVDLGGEQTIVQDVSLGLAQPCASVQPDAVKLALDPGQSTSVDLAVENTLGLAVLNWAADSASGMQGSSGHVLAQGADCEIQGGMAYNDVGRVGRRAGTAGSYTVYVDKFTPSGYPATLNSVCVVLTAADDEPFEAEVVIFDADGPMGEPGTELGALHVTFSDLPPFPIGEPHWMRIDISDLNLHIDEGSVYIGLRWNQSLHNSGIVMVDVFPDNRPVGHAGGYRSGVSGWEPITIPNPVQNYYRALLVRGLFDPRNCLEPGQVPWMDLAQTTGSITPGESAVLSIDMDAGTLVPGLYTASVCLMTDDPVRPLLVVPVELSVMGDPGPGLLAAEPPALDFGALEVGVSRLDSFLVRNATAPGADDLVLSAIDLMSGSPEFELAGGSCEAGSVLTPGTSCRVRVRLLSDDSNAVLNGAVRLEAADGQEVIVPLSGETLALPPAMSISPAVLESELEQGQTEAHDLVMENQGDQLLEWAVIDAKPDAGQVLRSRRREESDATGHAIGAHAHALTAPVLDTPARHALQVGAGQTTLTHSQSMDITGAGEACSNQSDGTTLANAYLRTFALSDFGINGPFEVSAVTFGIGVSTTTVPVAVNLYELRGDFLYENMVLIGSASLGVEAQEATLATVPVQGYVHPGTTLVVEVEVPDLTGHGGFFPGRNAAGQTAPSYLASAGCGMPEPVTYASIGFPNTHLAMSVTGVVESLECALAEWVEVDPASGSVSGGEARVATVTFDASGLEPGYNQAFLCLSSNDPEHPLTVVPLGLEVVPGSSLPGELTVTPTSLSFGGVAAGATATAVVSVSNVADASGGTIVVSNVELLSGSPDFSVDWGECVPGKTTLLPGESCAVEVGFSPSAPQPYVGVLQVRAADGQSVTVGLSGSGLDPDDAVFSDRFEQQ